MTKETDPVTIEATDTQTERAEKPEPKSGWWRPVLLLVAIAGLLVIAKVFGLGDRLGELRDWIQEMGALGPVVFVFLYAVAVVAALPGSALTVAAGALFGSLLGIVVVSVASTLGASLSFLVARYFARDATVGWLSSNEKFNRLDRLTGEHGATMVALTRLVPIFPFNLLNYGFGLTRVRFWTYVFWSWLCMLPGTVLYVVGADVVAKGIAEGKVSGTLLLSLAGAAVAVTFLVRFGRRRLKDSEQRPRFPR